jgi:hypothetical protein
LVFPACRRNAGELPNRILLLEEKKLDIRRVFLVWLCRHDYADYAYDDASRLQKVWQGWYSANYFYEPNSSLIDRVEYQFQSSTTRLTADRTHDRLNRLQAMNNLPQNGPAVNYGYQYNDANQRIPHGAGGWQFLDVRV